MKFRTGEKLHALMREAEQRFNVGMTEQVARTLRRHARQAIDISGVDDPGGSGGTVLTVPDCGHSPETLRRILFSRLNHELSKPCVKAYSTGLIQGIDYVVTGNELDAACAFAAE